MRLLIFLLAILIPACASSSLAFHMMYSAYKLNKQGDNIQSRHNPFPIWNQSVVPCLVLTLELLLLHPTDFGKVVFSLSLDEEFSDFFFNFTTDPLVLLNNDVWSRCILFFLFFFLWLIPSSIPLCLEMMFEIISIPLNLLGLVLCPNLWSILQNVSGAL